MLSNSIYYLEQTFGDWNSGQPGPTNCLLFDNYDGNQQTINQLPNPNRLNAKLGIQLSVLKHLVRKLIKSKFDLFKRLVDIFW